MAAPSPPVPRRGGSGACGTRRAARTGRRRVKSARGNRLPVRGVAPSSSAFFFKTSALRARRYLIARRNHRWRHAYLKQQSRRRCIGSYPAEHRLSMPRNGPGALEYAHTKANFNHFFPSNNARQGFKDHSPLSSGGIYRMTQTLSG